MQIIHSQPKCRDLHNGEKNSSQLCLGNLTGFLHFNCMTHCNKMIPLALSRAKYILGHRHSEWFVCFWKLTLSFHKMWSMFYFKEIQINEKTRISACIYQNFNWVYILHHCFWNKCTLIAMVPLFFLELLFPHTIKFIHFWQNKLLWCIYYRRKHQYNLNCTDLVLQSEWEYWYF